MKKSENRSRTSSEKKGFLIVLSAPSGCGKTTILTRLLHRHPDWLRSVSVTTRAPRPEEKNGRDYEFVTPRKFASLKRERAFLEWARVFSNDYGTRRRPLLDAVKAGRTAVLTVDVQGHRNIRKIRAGRPSFLSIFILPPSMQVLRERLQKRSTDSAEEIEERIHVAEEEIKTAREYDATVINHDLDQTIHEIEGRVSEFEKKLNLKEPKGSKEEKREWLTSRLRS